MVQSLLNNKAFITAINKAKDPSEMIKLSEASLKVLLGQLGKEKSIPCPTKVKLNQFINK